MSTSLKSASEKRGLGPGSLVHVGDVRQSETTLTLIEYGPAHFEKSPGASLQQVLDCRDRETVGWVIVEGLADASIVETIGTHFNIHPLVLEDILNTHQRPKLEEYDDYLFVVLKSLVAGDANFTVHHDQVSLVVMKNMLFVFKERADEQLAPVLRRLENSRGRFRAQGADYLMYAILDHLIDQNFDLLDDLEELLSSVEDEIFSNPSPELLERIHGIKLEVIRMRRHISPIRDLTAGLLRSESGLVQRETQIYLRDVHDHVLRIIESIETHRDILSSLLEIYLSSINSRMNEAMKVLTVFASIFIPLTFIAGIYGMNFEFMPELGQPWGYPAIWGVFIVTALTLYLFFRRKGWT